MGFLSVLRVDRLSGPQERWIPLKSGDRWVRDIVVMRILNHPAIATILKRGLESLKTFVQLG